MSRGSSSSSYPSISPAQVQQQTRQLPLLLSIDAADRGCGSVAEWFACWTQAQ